MKVHSGVSLWGYGLLRDVVCGHDGPTLFDRIDPILPTEGMPLLDIISPERRA